MTQIHDAKLQKICSHVISHVTFLHESKAVVELYYGAGTRVSCLICKVFYFNVTETPTLPSASSSLEVNTGQAQLHKNSIRVCKYFMLQIICGECCSVAVVLL